MQPADWLDGDRRGTWLRLHELTRNAERRAREPAFPIGADWIALDDQLLLPLLWWESAAVSDILFFCVKVEPVSWKYFV